MRAAEESGLAFWNKTRSATLRDLALNQHDRSNVGCVDAGIVPLVGALNADERYYTQSSCSGRVAAFHRMQDGGVAKRKRGAGRGNVFSSHDPVADVSAVAEQVYAALTTCNTTEGDKNWDLTHGVVELKFEPVMMHVACRSVAAAQSLLEAATSSGLRSSGVIAMPRVKINVPREAPEGGAAADRDEGVPHVPLVDIIPELPGEGQSRRRVANKASMRMMTVSIAGKFGFSAPLAIEGAVTVASPAALEVMLRQANDLFIENEARKARLLDAVLNRQQVVSAGTASEAAETH